MRDSNQSLFNVETLKLREGTVYNFIKEKYVNSPVLQAFNVLDRPLKNKMVRLSFLQTSLAFLDLAGVISIGAVVALCIQGVESRQPGNNVSKFLRILHLETFNLNTQVLALGAIAGTIFIVKTLVSIFITRKVFYFLSRQGAQISSELVSRFISQNLSKIQSQSTQEFIYIISDGVRSLLVGVVGSALTLASDFVLLIILSIGLFFADPIIAAGSLVIFSLTAFILHQLLEVRAKELGLLLNKLIIKSNEKILEVLSTFRESVARNRRGFYSEQIRNLRMEQANLFAESNFQSYIGKYVIETISVLGTLLLASYEFGTKDSVHAAAILSVFLVASSRIAPAVLRIQQGLLTIKSNLGNSDLVFQLLEDMSLVQPSTFPGEEVSFIYDGFKPDIVIKNLNFKYPGVDNFALSDINLEIPEGKSIAIVGPSGAGKTTLIDLILGVLEPDLGTIAISGLKPLGASAKWPGAISYVPQDVIILPGTIRENIALGFELNLATDTRVNFALGIAQLSAMVSDLPEGVETLVQERGARLSGGQRQRLGVARALFTTPKLLVLDEATSSLDGQTELDLSDSLEKLSGQITLIIVAHRLSTVKRVDLVAYMERGRILKIGTFDQVRNSIPNFDQQAKLMGL